MFVLSAEDVAVLKDLLRWWRAQPENGLPPKEQDRVNQASDVYVAKPPSSGIPPRVDTKPGKATCDIYKIDKQDDLVAIPGLTKVVYNLSNTWIQSDYVSVEKLKSGKWVAGVEGGLGSTGTGTGTSTGDTCVEVLAGIYLDRIPPTVATQVDYVLGISQDGCLVKIPLEICPETTGTG